MSRRLFHGQLADDIAGDDRLRAERLRLLARSLVDIVRDALVRTGVVRIHGFGTFRLTHVKARRGINPQTGEPIDIPARNRVLFRPAKALRDRIEPDLPAAVPLAEPHESREARLGGVMADAPVAGGLPAADNQRTERRYFPDRVAAAAMAEPAVRTTGSAHLPARDSGSREANLGGLMADSPSAGRVVLRTAGATPAAREQDESPAARDDSSAMPDESRSGPAESPSGQDEPPAVHDRAPRAQEEAHAAKADSPTAPRAFGARESREARLGTSGEVKAPTAGALPAEDAGPESQEPDRPATIPATQEGPPVPPRGVEEAPARRGGGSREAQLGSEATRVAAAGGLPEDDSPDVESSQDWVARDTAAPAMSRGPDEYREALRPDGQGEQPVAEPDREQRRPASALGLLAVLLLLLLLGLLGWWLWPASEVQRSGTPVAAGGIERDATTATGATAGDDAADEAPVAASEPSASGAGTGAAVRDDAADEAPVAAGEPPASGAGTGAAVRDDAADEGPVVADEPPATEGATGTALRDEAVDEGPVATSEPPATDEATGDTTASLVEATATETGGAGQAQDSAAAAAETDSAAADATGGDRAGEAVVGATEAQGEAPGATAAGAAEAVPEPTASTSVQAAAGQAEAVAPEGTAAAAEPEATASAPAATGGTPWFSSQEHVVTRGDTLWDLSDVHYVNPYYWPHIWNHNQSLPNPDRIEIDQVLLLPTLEGEPRNLTAADRRSIAEGYLRLYRLWQRTDAGNPQYALVGVRYFDPAVMPPELRDDPAAGLPGDALAAAFAALLEAEFPIRR